MHNLTFLFVPPLGVFLFFKVVNMGFTGQGRFDIVPRETLGMQSLIQREEVLQLIS